MERLVRARLQRWKFVEHLREEIVRGAVFLFLVERACGELHESVFRTVLLGEDAFVALKILLRCRKLLAIEQQTHHLKSITLGKELVRFRNSSFRRVD